MKKIVAVLCTAVLVVSISAFVFAGEKEDMEGLEKFYKSAADPKITVIQATMMIMELSKDSKDTQALVNNLRRVAEMVPEKAISTMVRLMIVDTLKKQGRNEEAVGELFKIIQERTKELKKAEEMKNMPPMPPKQGGTGEPKPGMKGEPRPDMMRDMAPDDARRMMEGEIDKREKMIRELKTELEKRESAIKELKAEKEKSK